MTEKDRMLAGKLYVASDEELVAARRRARRLTRLYNATTEEERSPRAELLSELFAGVGREAHVEPSFRCDYGSNITVGEMFYANYDCIILDICRVTIGDYVMLAPRVCIYTAGHPLDAAIRNEMLEFGKPVTIGNNVWIGGNAVITPGVTIGDNAVIGAGSVVTKDIPANVVAFGNPCRVFREITDEDKRYWERLKAEYYDSLN